MKKSFYLIKIKKEKSHQLYCLIFYSFAYFIKLVKQPYFYLLKDLIDGLAIGGAESKRRKIAIYFFG